MTTTKTKAKPDVIAVVGPTATGKTTLGVQLAQALQSEVISADSQLMYQQLNIGTAKPTAEEQKGVTHHVLDCVPPDQSYSVADYKRQAGAKLKELIAKGQTPVVVGGTGFYLRALLQDGFLPSVAPDEVFRERLKVIAEEKGRLYLHQQLAEKDPRRAADLHPNDLFRVIRALEIIEKTGKPVADNRLPNPYNVHWIGLTFEDRDKHRQLIDSRIDAMLKAGWLDEIREVIAQYGAETHALQVAHGYPEWVEHLQGKLTYKAALEQIQINIHQYARRQMTWFQRNEAIQWFDVGEKDGDESSLYNPAKIVTSVMNRVNPA